MAFNDLFASPIPTEPVTQPTTGFPNLFANEPPAQVARQQKIQQATVQTAQAQQQAQQVGSFGGLVKSTISNISGTVGGILTNVKNAALAPPASKPNLIQHPYAPLEAGAKSLTDTIQDSANRLTNAVKTVQDSHASALQKGVAIGEAGMGVLNGLFTPITTTLAAVSTVPVVGYGADAVNNLFGAIGSLGADAAQQPVDALPVSEQTKAQIRPLVREIGALSTQLVTGKLGSDYIPQIADKSKQVLGLIKDDTQIKAQATPKAPVEAPVTPKTVPTAIETPKVENATTRAFDASTGQVKVGNFELGSFGKNNLNRKETQVDRFPVSELTDTQKYITDAYKASDNPTNYRSDNIAWIAKMPNGETRVIYTRQNVKGTEEIINAHRITDPKFIDTLKTFGTPAETRTRIFSLERSNSSPLNYGDNNKLNTTSSELQPLAQEAKTSAKPSKVGTSIETKAIEDKLTEGFGGTAGYDPITIKEQAQMVSDLIDSDLEKAKRMMAGEEPIPHEMRGASLIAGLEEYALKKKDAELLKEIAQSPLTSETSRHAQEMRMLAERTPDSAVRIIQELKKAREDSIKENTGDLKKTKRAVVNDIKAQIKKAVSKRPSWEEFIDDIKCNY